MFLFRDNLRTLLAIWPLSQLNFIALLVDAFIFNFHVSHIISHSTNKSCSSFQCLQLELLSSAKIKFITQFLLVPCQILACQLLLPSPLYPWRFYATMEILAIHQNENILTSFWLFWLMPHFCHPSQDMSIHPINLQHMPHCSPTDSQMLKVVNATCLALSLKK